MTNQLDRIIHRGNERDWVRSIREFGWTTNDTPDRYRQFERFGPRNGFNTLEVNKRAEIIWDPRWFNPLLSTWGGKFAFLSSFARQKPEREMITHLRENMGIDSVLFANEIIKSWLNLDPPLLKKEGDQLTLSAEFVKQVVGAEDVLQGAGRIMEQTELDEMYGSPITLPEKAGRIKLHGVIIDLDYLGVDQEWIWRLIDAKGRALYLDEVSRVDPLNLDQIGNLDEAKRGEIVKAIFDELATRFERAEITFDGVFIQIGSPEEVGKYFVAKLEGLQSSVQGLVNEARLELNDTNSIRKEAEKAARIRSIGSSERDMKGRALTIRGVFLQNLDQKAAEGGQTEDGQSESEV